jgi:arylsulfatase A-like enzyme
MLKDDNKPVRQAAFTENPWGKRIRKKDWCLAHYPRQMYPGMKEDVGELYDMVNDPWQLKNLYRDPAQRERIADLRRELMDWLITTTHIVTMNPPAATYDPNRKDKKRRQVPQTEGLGEDGRQPWRAIQRAAEAKGWSYL